MAITWHTWYTSLTSKAHDDRPGFFLPVKTTSELLSICIPLPGLLICLIKFLTVSKHLLDYVKEHISTTQKIYFLQITCVYLESSG